MASEEEYGIFYKQHKYHNFMNSLEMMRLKQNRGIPTEIVGVKDNRTFLAMCIVSYHPIMKIFHYACIQRGALIDYQDKVVFSFFIQKLKKHLSKKGCVYLHMDPYLIYKERDGSGAEIKHGFSNENIVQGLQTQGFKHQGFTTGFSEKYQVRWTFVLPLKDKSEAEILANMHKQTRHHIQKTLHDEICIKEISTSELSIFMKILKHTGERGHFAIRDDVFYKDYLKAYGDKAKLLLAYLNISKYIDKQSQYQQDATQIIESHTSTLDVVSKRKAQKRQNIIAIEKTKIDEYQKKIKEAQVLKELYGNEIPLSACFFVIEDNEIIYLSGGSYKHLSKYKAIYALQWHMIQLAIKKGCNQYNFYGISGNFNEDAEDYGVFKFKQKFGGHVEELIGDFILPIKKPYYKLYNLMKRGSK